MGIPKQVILQETLQDDRKVRNIVKNILITFGAKLEYEPWGVSKVPIINQVPTLVVAIDVGHGLSHANQSVMSITAVLNRTASKYYTSYLVQDVDRKQKDWKQTLRFDLDSQFQKLIQAFQDSNNGVSPKQIIVYRSSTSEGQTATLRANECQQVSAIIDNMVDSGLLPEKPGFLYSTVNIRCENRFFEKSKRGYVNPQKGLVIENGVTDGSKWEFYMISHAGPTGLQSPVRYDVLVNEGNDFKVQDVYDLTHNLAYVYYNFQNSIKVPAPLRYCQDTLKVLSKAYGSSKQVGAFPDSFENKLFMI